MKKYKSYDELKADVAAKLAAFDTVTNLLYGLSILSDDGIVIFDTYDYLNDCFQDSEDAAGFIENVRRNYSDLKSHYESMKPWERKNTWNDPRVYRRLRRYVRCNFDPALWEGIPEFASVKKGDEDYREVQE